MKITPVGAPQAPHPTITVNTSPKGNTVLEKIKQRFGSLPEAAKAPLNKPGQPIPPQPSGQAQTTQPKPFKQEIEPTSTPNVEQESVPAKANQQVLNVQQAARARQERAFRDAQRKFQEEKAAWEQNKANFIPKDKLNADTLKTLAEAGISYDKLVELQLAQVPNDPNQILLDRIASLETKLAESTTKVEESLKTRDQQAYDQAKRQIQADVDLLVDSDPKYETIKATKNSHEVVSLIEKVFNEEGKLLSVEEAASAIEDVAYDNELKRIESYRTLSKFKDKLGQAQAAMQGQEATSAKPSANTITNNMGSSRPLTPRERAILAFQEAEKRRG
jgi:hypothetical protein